MHEGGAARWKGRANNGQGMEQKECRLVHGLDAGMTRSLTLPYCSGAAEIFLSGPYKARYL